MVRSNLKLIKSFRTNQHIKVKENVKIEEIVFKKAGKTKKKGLKYCCIGCDLI